MSEVAIVTGRGEPEVATLSLMRRAMARHMIEAVSVPCFYLRVSADVTELIARRQRLRESTDAAVPTLNDAVVRAVAVELRAHPIVNSAYLEGTVARFPRVNVGVAVAVEGGLVVPAIYDADEKSLDEVAVAVRHVADLAARRQLTRELLADATFTVSNLGMHGIEDFDPLINPPQAAILGVGAAAGAADGRRLMRLTLGCDHRVLTGAEGAPFLVAVRDRLERGEDLFVEHAEREP